MKKTAQFLLFIIPLAVLLCTQEQEAALWRQDLDYLVKRIEIMHPDPYSFITKSEFHKLKNKLSREIPSMNEAEIVISIAELVAKLRDGHTRMGIEYSDPQWLNQTFHLLPVIMYPFDDGIYIMAGMPEYRELVGSQVVKIGNMPAAEAARKLGPLYGHDNRFGQLKTLYYTLGFAEMLKHIGAVESVDKIALTLRNQKNKKVEIEISTVPLLNMARFLGTWYPQADTGLATMNEGAANPLPIWLKRQRGEKFGFEYLPEDKIMVLQINSLNYPHGDETGPFGKLCTQFFEAFDGSGAKKLVIDIRANDGGNHVELPLLRGIIARPRIDRHDRLFLIIGRVTYSAAVHFTTVFSRYTNATLIGEPTAGRPNHYGAIRRFTLPNHPRVTITCSIDYYQDSQPFDFNTTHFPDIRTPILSSDYRNNIDPALKAVKNYDRIFHLAEALVQELAEEYTANGFQAMTRLYHSKKQGLIDSGYNLEKFFSEFYENRFSKIKKSEADLLDTLTLAVAECPDSIDLNYYLAYYLEKAGRIDDARKYYRRCLQLNPAHHYASMKLDLMDLIKQ
jgi:hypothetical protein